MVEAKKFKSSKRFGARYGRTIKKNFAKIEQEQRRLHKCPYCSKIAVKRLAAGIWQCKKCNEKFTSKAYTTETASKSQLIEEKEEEENG